MARRGRGRNRQPQRASRSSSWRGSPRDTEPQREWFRDRADYDRDWFREHDDDYAGRGFARGLGYEVESPRDPGRRDVYPESWREGDFGMDPGRGSYDRFRGEGGMSAGLGWGAGQRERGTGWGQGRWDPSALNWQHSQRGFPDYGYAPESEWRGPEWRARAGGEVARPRESEMYTWGPYSGRGPRGYNRSDERIHEEVCEMLMVHGGIDASDIEVRTESGEVTLEGTVPERRMKRWAEDLVESARGVKDVHNRLRVSDTPRTD